MSDPLEEVQDSQSEDEEFKKVLKISETDFGYSIPLDSPQTMQSMKTMQNFEESKEFPTTQP
jgi:hypothetical protein